MDINLLRERDVVAPLSVSELNGYIKNLFESNRSLSAVTVRGEISNFKLHSSGHLYFSLKDAEGQIRAVMFRSKAMGLKFMPDSGMKVIVHGSVTVYAKDGSYQIYVSSMQPDGIGALYLAYEQMKARLLEEGLFDSEYKRNIPRFPEKVGVITSPTGAAVRDVINVVSRRWPPAKIYLYPSLVQGDGAEANLVSALEYFERTKLVDVIIIGRGGGSIEDLWAFNSEALARKIFDSTIPIISAVGHETDFTICDFVADLRAPTPSAAAELCVPDINDLTMQLVSVEERVSLAMDRMISSARERTMRYDVATLGLSLSRVFSRLRERIAYDMDKADGSVVYMIESQRKRLALYAEKANALSPLSVISRGYAIAEKNSEILRSVSQISLGDQISLRVSDGNVMASVTEIFEES